MPFFKKDNDELLVSHTRVDGPGFSLDADTHGEHTYPVDGWYWFDDLDTAMVALAKPQGVVTIRQGRLALLQTGLLDDIETAVAASGNRALQIEWEFATEFRRDWPALISMQRALGLTDEAVDDLFRLAVTL